MGSTTADGETENVDDDDHTDLKPKEVILLCLASNSINLIPALKVMAQLDRYIVGQRDAKKTVAVAYRKSFKPMSESL